MEHRTSYIANLLDQSPVSRNQIAAISGLSNPYLRELEQGHIANVGREKLIAFAVALNLDLRTTDEMLGIFDRAGLSEQDIPLFLEVSKKCRISAALHPVKDDFTFDLVIFAAEQIAGDHVLVSPRPAACLRPEGHRLYTEKDLVQDHPLYGPLVETITLERRRNLMFQLIDHPVEQYICKKCLEDYITRCSDPLEKAWRIKHIKNTMQFIDSYSRFRFFLTTECPSFSFIIKTPKNNSAHTEKLILTALAPHRFQVKTTGLLSGFATDNQAVVLNFKKELKSIQATVVEAFTEKDKLLNFLESLVERNA
jgi:transcriptional regulator with XRE-family HTH domain